MLKPNSCGSLVAFPVGHDKIRSVPVRPEAFTAPSPIRTTLDSTRWLKCRLCLKSTQRPKALLATRPEEALEIEDRVFEGLKLLAFGDLRCSFHPKFALEPLDGYLQAGELTLA